MYRLRFNARDFKLIVSPRSAGWVILTSIAAAIIVAAVVTMALHDYLWSHLGRQGSTVIVFYAVPVLYLPAFSIFSRLWNPELKDLSLDYPKWRGRAIATQGSRTVDGRVMAGTAAIRWTYLSRLLLFAEILINTNQGMLSKLVIAPAVLAVVLWLSVRIQYVRRPATEPLAGEDYWLPWF